MVFRLCNVMRCQLYFKAILYLPCDKSCDEWQNQILSLVLPHFELSCSTQTWPSIYLPLKVCLGNFSLTFQHLFLIGFTHTQIWFGIFVKCVIVILFWSWWSYGNLSLHVLLSLYNNERRKHLGIYNLSKKKTSRYI